MKKLIIIFAFIPSLCFGQDSQISKYSIGDEFRLASRHWYTGIVISTVGTGFSLLAINSGDGVFLVPGIALNVIGFIFMIRAWSHINKAGMLMNDKKMGITFNNGIGLRYRI